MNALTEDKLFLDITNVPIELPKSDNELNPIEKMCQERNWNFLDINEEMIVNFNKKKYKVVRIN